MKKILSLLCIAAGIGMASSIDLHMDKEGVSLTGIALEQVEALAKTESEHSDSPCRSLGCLDCPKGSVKVKYIS